MLSALENVFASLLASFSPPHSTSIEEDEGIMSSTPVSPSLRCALVYRLGQKRILSSALTTLKQLQLNQED
jgi:hypothetical protein